MEQAVAGCRNQRKAGSSAPSRSLLTSAATGLSAVNWLLEERIREPLSHDPAGDFHRDSKVCDNDSALSRWYFRSLPTPPRAWYLLSHSVPSD